MTRSSYSWNEYQDGQRFWLLLPKPWITLSFNKLYDRSSFYTLFLGGYREIETCEVTWQDEELLKSGLLGSNIFGTGFKLYQSKPFITLSFLIILVFKMFDIYL